MDQFLQALINGVMLGGFYAVMALGFSVIWGVMGVINLAHGEFLMMGAYFAWALFRAFDIDPFVSMIIVMPVMFVVGYGLQKILVNRIVERPHLIALLVTYGLAISIANLYKLIYSADPRIISVTYNGSITIGNLTFPIVKTLILVCALVIMLALHLFLQHTRLGKSIRAAAQNKTAARIVGIEVDNVYALTFGICIAVTAAAGAMMSMTTPIFPFMGPPFTLRAFTITALGGLGRIPGVLLGGMLLGIIEIMVATFVPGIGTTLGIATSFILLVVVLIVRPQGLLQGLRPMEETE